MVLAPLSATTFPIDFAFSRRLFMVDTDLTRNGAEKKMRAAKKQAKQKRRISIFTHSLGQ